MEGEKNMLKNPRRLSSGAMFLFCLIFLLCFSDSVLAWNEPSGIPPGNNVAAPLNTGGDNQTKTGGLNLGIVTTTQLCLGTTCKSSWDGISGGQWVSTTPPAAPGIYYPGRVGIGGDPQSDTQLYLRGNSNTYGGLYIYSPDTSTTWGMVSNSLNNGIWTMGKNTGIYANGLESGIGVYGTSVSGWSGYFNGGLGLYASKLCVGGTSVGDCTSNLSSLTSFWTKNGSNNIYNNNSGGNVGIGTNNPLDALQIGSGISLHNGGHKVIAFGWSPASGTALMTGKPSEIRWDPNSGGISFGTNANTVNAGALSGIGTKVSITADGYLGIGTTNPDRRLIIQGSEQRVESRIVNTSGANGQRAQFCSFIGSSYGCISRTGDGETSSIGPNNTLFYNNGASEDFVFMNTSAFTEKLRIKGNTGNIGIGTSNPQESLHLYSNASSKPLIERIDYQGGSNNSSLAFYGTELVNETGISGFMIGTGKNYPITGVFRADQVSLQSNLPGGIAIVTRKDLTGGTTAGDIVFATDGYQASNERMRIAANGNIGMGTTVSPVEELDIRPNVVSSNNATFLMLSGGQDSYQYSGVDLYDSTPGNTGYLWRITQRKVFPGITAVDHSFQIHSKDNSNPANWTVPVLTILPVGATNSSGLTRAGFIGLNGIIDPVSPLQVQGSSNRGMRITSSDGSSRITFDAGGSYNMWNIDNNAGSFRIFRETYSSTGSGGGGVVAMSIDGSSVANFNGDIDLNSKNAFRGNDTWLRLNQDSQFTSGIHTPGFFNSYSASVGALYSNPGAGNLQVQSKVGAALYCDQNMINCQSIASLGSGGGVGGSGTTNYLPKFTATSTLGNSIIYDNGSSVTIGVSGGASNLVVPGDGTGVARIGDPGFSSGNYTGISLNGSLSTGNYNILSGATDYTLYINRPTGNSIHFRENNVTQMMIASGGNIGIGTTSPASNTKLEVSNGAVGLKIMPGQMWNGSAWVADNNYVSLDVEGSKNIGIVDNLVIAGTGNGIVFPDGTKQTTAASVGSGFSPFTWKHYFITQATYNGNLGGQTGANAKCNSDVNKLSGRTYTAFLDNSDSFVASYTKTQDSIRPMYFNDKYGIQSVDGVATIDTHFWRKTNSPNGGVWNGPEVDCSNWTSANAIAWGGGAKLTSPGFSTPIASNINSTWSCFFPWNLLCVEQ